MNVAAIIVTRGDQDLTPVVTSLPEAWEVVIWDNSTSEIDVSVYGRYAAIDETTAELIYVQDDDCVVSDPTLLVRAWEDTKERFGGEHVVCNMPQEFRHEFYEDHGLVGFGAVFRHDLPDRAFRRWEEHVGILDADVRLANVYRDGGFFDRTCDIVFTGLTPRVLVDVPYENLPWAFHETRMWKQPGHVAERVRMLDLVGQVRDGR